MGVTLFAVHLGGWDSNPPSVIKLSRSASSFLAPHPRCSSASFRGNESHRMFAVLVKNHAPSARAPWVSLHPWSGCVKQRTSRSHGVLRSHPPRDGPSSCCDGGIFQQVPRRCLEQFGGKLPARDDRRSTEPFGTGGDAPLVAAPRHQDQRYP